MCDGCSREGWLAGRFLEVMGVRRFVPGAWGATRTLRTLTIALLIAAVAWTLAEDARPADASHTKIILSRSNTSPTPEGSLIVSKNGTPVDLYIWAVNVHNATGASAFDVRFDFDPALGDIIFLEWYETWLGSTNRSPVCIAAIGPNVVVGLEDGQAYVECNTFSIPPPYGATGTGLIGHIQFKPGPAIMSAGMDMLESFLVDTPPNPADWQKILPLAAPYVYVIVGKCADFDLNGTIDLFNDIFGVAFRYGLSVGDPGWDPKYDIDDNGNIDLFNDIFITAFQFGGSC